MDMGKTNRSMDFKTIFEKVELLNLQMHNIDQTISELFFFLPAKKQDKMLKTYRKFSNSLIELRSEAEDYLRPK